MDSAGILMYYTPPGGALKVLLVHPGGPYFRKRQQGWWSIPKGLPQAGESLRDAAIREFREETGFAPAAALQDIGSIKQKAGKIVHAWACHGRLPQGWQLQPDTFEMEWPPKSGRKQRFPEIDMAEFMEIEKAYAYLIAAQRPFLDRLLALLK